MKKPITYTIFFFSIVILDLIGLYYPETHLPRFITKSLIVISLIAVSLLTSLDKKIKIGLLSALGFSLIGDFVLIFANQVDWAFIAGLSAFLIAHILYALLFNVDIDWRKINNQTVILSIIGLGSYALLFIYIIYDRLGPLLVPVGIYVLAILMMAFLSILRNRLIPKSSWTWVFVGALLFIMSDSLLAFNKFYQPINHADLWVMISYASAQYCIVRGILTKGRKPTET